MKKNLSNTAELTIDAFGSRIAARLAAGEKDLPHDISERLRVARQQAVAARRHEPVLVQHRPIALEQAALAGAHGGSNGGEGGWWTRLGSVLPLVLLVGGLITISVLRTDQRAHELAEVDAQILVDDLPPAAYADPGFLQFLRSSAASESANR